MDEMTDREMCDAFTMATGWTSNFSSREFNVFKLGFAGGEARAMAENKRHYDLGREQQAIQDAEKLAACQAHNVELREALFAMQHSALGMNCGLQICDEALSRTTDTEALDAAIAKAVDGCAEICAEEAKKIWLQYDRENPDLYQEGWGDCADYFAAKLRARGKP